MAFLLLCGFFPLVEFHKQGYVRSLRSRLVNLLIGIECSAVCCIGPRGLVKYDLIPLSSQIAPESPSSVWAVILKLYKGRAKNTNIESVTTPCQFIPAAVCEAHTAGRLMHV